MSRFFEYSANRKLRVVSLLLVPIITLIILDSAKIGNYFEISNRGWIYFIFLLQI